MSHIPVAKGPHHRTLHRLLYRAVDNQAAPEVPRRALLRRANMRTLKSLKLLYHDTYGYEPAFNRTNLTDLLQQNANILIETGIVTKPAMRKILKQIKEH